jgi:hypothetical protein
MNLVTLAAGDLVADTIQFITPVYAALLKSKGYRGVTRYVTAVVKEELDNCFAQGLAVGFVTYANRWDPYNVLSHLHALGTPQGHHVALDVEGVTLNAFDLIAKERNWCKAIIAGGFIPMRYAGAQQLLTGREQYLMPYRAYWHSCSDVVDRFGAASVPNCGYMTVQDKHYNVTLAPGYIVDNNHIVGDKAGRFPIFVGA